MRIIKDAIRRWLNRLVGRRGEYPNTFDGGMSKSADIADLMACSTDDHYRREMQLWVGREIRSSRDWGKRSPNSVDKRNQ
jgi:hypothetical protein